LGFPAEREHRRCEELPGRCPDREAVGNRPGSAGQIPQRRRSGGMRDRIGPGARFHGGVERPRYESITMARTHAPRHQAEPRHRRGEGVSGEKDSGPRPSPTRDGEDPQGPFHRDQGTPPRPQEAEAGEGVAARVGRLGCDFEAMLLLLGVWAAWVASGPHKPFRARTDAVLQSIRFGTLHRYSLDLVPLRKQAERQRGCADGTPTFEGGRISRSVRSVTLNGHDRWDSNTGDLNGVPRSTGKWIEPGSGAPGSLNMVS